MTDWGLMSTGFKPKTFQAIKDEIEDELKKTVDPHLRFSPDTVAGQITGIIANQTRQVWEMAAALYASIDSHTASNRALDALCALTGTYRKQATASRAMIQVTLGPYTTLPPGLIVADATNANARFKTQGEIKNDANEPSSVAVEVVAEEYGPTHVQAGKLTKIVTPHAGLIAINNPEDAIPGRFIESDADLRIRRIRELAAPGSSTHGAMTARLVKLEGVEAVHIEEQDHSFCAYVAGGDEQDIAETIWQHKPLGVHTSGEIAKEVTASNGQKKIVRFNRPLPIELMLQLNLRVRHTLNDRELFELKNDIVNYCKLKFSFGHVPYTAQIYPVLFAHEKILDVITIRFKRARSTEPVPRVVKPHEILSIATESIHIQQVLEEV
jgi:uncharacterized phage protein gp47/JayE